MPSLVDHVLSKLSTMTHESWMALQDCSWFHWIRQGSGPCDQFDQFSVILVFILPDFWWRSIRGLWKLPDGRNWLRGKLGPVLMGRAMISKSLTQFFADGWVCVPSLLFDLMPNHGGGNEDNVFFLQKFLCPHCFTQYPQPCTRLPLIHASNGDSWTLMGKCGSVSCGALLLSPPNSSQIYWKYLFSRALNKTWSLSSSHLKYPD